MEPDRNSYDDEIEAEGDRTTGRNGRERDRDRYNYRPEQKQRGPRGSSSGGPSTGMDLHRSSILCIVIKCPVNKKDLCNFTSLNIFNYSSVSFILIFIVILLLFLLVSML